MLSEEKIKEEIREEIKEEIREEIKEEIREEIKKAEIKEVVKKVNDLFRERNYFKSITKGYSHLPENIVKSKYDGDQKYKDGTDFFYPLIKEYAEAYKILDGECKEKATFTCDSKKFKCYDKEFLSGLPKPDHESPEEYQDFKCLICCKKETEPKFFKDYTFDSIGSPAKQLYYYKDRDSEDSLLRLSGDRLFHFPQLMPNSDDPNREKAFSLLKKLKKNDSSRSLVNAFTKASALPGGYIFWRVVGSGKGINSARGGQWPVAGDRFDLALVALRQWFAESGDDAKNRDSNVLKLLEAFDDEKKEEKAKYPFFLNKNESGWEDFVKFFELERSFVREGDYRVYNQVSDPFEEEMEVFPDKNKDWDGKLKKSWSDPKHDGGIPPEIENYLINGIKTIVKRTERLNEVLHRA